MAWIAVRTNDGEESASWEADGPVWGLTVEQAFPGLSAAIEHAIESDRSRPGVDVDCICPHRTSVRPYKHLAMCPIG
jgi:hypothetical protein